MKVQKRKQKKKYNKEKENKYVNYSPAHHNRYNTLVT